jgi:hypothetical protein
MTDNSHRLMLNDAISTKKSARIPRQKTEYKCRRLCFSKSQLPHLFECEKAE